MKLYAEVDRIRNRQVATDAAAAAGMILSTVLGVVLYRLVAVAAAPGESIQKAGEAVGSLPALGGVGAALADVGRTQQEVVLSLAFWLGFGVAAVGVAAVLLAYLPGRLTWASEAAAAAQLRSNPADLRVLAYRAVARRPLSRITRAVPDPGLALATGDYLQLANLELEELGLHPPA